uniref:Valine--tRNA ligase, mitochondrial n=1 Tax=Catharus ustulatus TaxID=91951 RepID=A0A8C3UIK7_CATUS
MGVLWDFLRGFLKEFWGILCDTWGPSPATQVPLPPRYSPRYVEAAWYQWWERGGVFRPPQQVRGPPQGVPHLSLVLPPPNVTGSLHLGHALGATLQDVLARWRRMQGWSVLWVPGTDHAGIATQAVVERWLWQRRRQRPQDLGRAEFLREVWSWKERHGDEILEQLRALGASLDWSRERFTMDPGFSRAVTEAFVLLFRAGLIRRDLRAVTWSCALRSSISDIEVEPRVLAGPTQLSVPNCPHPVTFGVLVTFAYPVEGDDGLEVPVATTRPETLFGDVAVAVNPRDPRYLVRGGANRGGGASPGVTGVSHLSPGAVKVTPGHSPQDLALARAHSLPLLSVIGDDGALCPPGGGWLQGVPRFQARPLVVAALAQLGLLRGVQDHAMTLPLCSRSGDVVEFLLKRQWFLSCEEMAREALQAVTSGRLHLVPKFHEKNWKSWMENVGDWCLSRQLWWGHRVPAYQVREPPGAPGAEGPWFVGRSEAEARAEAAETLGCSPGQVQLQQDPDVLDTWFSSALFPFAALVSLVPFLVSPIPFFVSPIPFLGSLVPFFVSLVPILGSLVPFLGSPIPFSVLLHSLVRDSQGRKMSKSLGNVIDPRDVIRGATLQSLQFPRGIPECGADALRLALSSHNVQGESPKIPQKHPKNILKIVSPVTPLDLWVLSRAAAAVGSCWAHLERLQVFGISHPNFIFSEVSKASLQVPSLRPSALATLLACAELGLRLLAPFAPFVAEELWQRLPRPEPAPNTICRAPFPEPRALVSSRHVAARGGSHVVGVVSSLTVLLQCPEPARDWLEPLGPAFQTLSGAGPVELLPPGAEPGPGWVGAPAGSGNFVHLRIQVRAGPALGAGFGFPSFPQ